MIITGFAGIGKSSVTKTIPNIIDLESTPFEKDWDRYVKVAKHMDKQGHVVLISCHKELREKLREEKIPYLCVMPEKDLKDEYLKRYKERGNDKEFIKSLKDNWDNYTKPLPNEFVFRLKSEEYLYDIIWALPVLQEELDKYYKEKFKECESSPGPVTSSSFSSQAPENIMTTVNPVKKDKIKEFFEEKYNIDIDEICID